MTLKLLLAAVALLGALRAGFDFAYGTVIAALRDAEPGSAADAMTRMNVSVLRSPFVALIMASALTAAVAAVWLVVAGKWTPAGILGMVGSGFLVVALGVTVALNVPLNDQLEAGTIEWAEFVRGWAAWNLVRTVLCLAGALGTGIAAVRLT